MGTATSRVALGVGLLALALTAPGCGSSTPTPTPIATTTAAPAFAWLVPTAAPAGWRHARIASGAVFSYPASWQPIHGDRGTASAALLDAHGRYLAYLNLTPRQGAETQANWPAFRVHHNDEEGDTRVVAQASAHGLRFRNGRGSCVRDAYTTTTGAHYTELACLVNGPHASSVIVGAAPPDQWARQQPTIERAIATFTS